VLALSGVGFTYDTLLHRKALLVITASNLENCAVELVAEGIARDFIAHASVHEHSQLAVVFDFDHFLGPWFCISICSATIRECAVPFWGYEMFNFIVAVEKDRLQPSVDELWKICENTKKSVVMQESSAPSKVACAEFTTLGKPDT
jgi:hypothetical protein